MNYIELEEKVLKKGMVCFQQQLDYLERDALLIQIKKLAALKIMTEGADDPFVHALYDVYRDLRKNKNQRIYEATTELAKAFADAGHHPEVCKQAVLKFDAVCQVENKKHTREVLKCALATIGILAAVIVASALIFAGAGLLAGALVSPAMFAKFLTLGGALSITAAIVLPLTGVAVSSFFLPKTKVPGEVREVSKLARGLSA
jgi:hypothetical protein